MKTYTVWFLPKGSSLIKADGGYTFIYDVPGYALAKRIAENLESEGFASEAWVEED